MASPHLGLPRSPGHPPLVNVLFAAQGSFLCSSEEIILGLETQSPKYVRRNGTWSCCGSVLGLKEEDGAGCGDEEGGGAFTQRDQAPVVFQHHTPVQTPLSRVQPLPLLWGELYSHIPKCHQALKRQKHILAGPVLRPCPPNAHVEAPTPHTQKVTVFGDGAFKEVTKS